MSLEDLNDSSPVRGGVLIAIKNHWTSSLVEIPCASYIESYMLR